MKRILITFGSIVLIGLVGLTGLNSKSILADASRIDTTTAQQQTRVFSIENMTCAACPITVKKAMARVEGVKEVIVDFDAKTATAVFDPTIAKVEDIASASTDVGYPATPVESE